MRSSPLILSWIGCCAMLVMVACQSLAVDETKPLRRVEKKVVKETASPTEGETYLLRYQFAPGMVVKSEVIHLAKSGAKIDDSQQDCHSRTVSQKSWKFTDVNDDEMTFEYRIDSVDMSQRVGAATEIRYNSADGSEPAPQFRNAANAVGKIISVVSIDRHGSVVARSDDTNPPHLGMGDITLPLPSSPVAVGATWEIPRELRIQREDGSLKTIKFRELFRLEKVSAGVATVSVRSEPLTALSDAKEEAQVLQQLSNGTIKFDIDAGRMISKSIAWDENVVGVAGAGSLVDYSARLDEQVTNVETVTASNKRTAGKEIRSR